VLADFAVDDASLEVYQTRLFEFAIKCREEALFPCLCFQLDSFRCLEMFKDLLGQLESRQLLECVHGRRSNCRRRSTCACVCVHVFVCVSFLYFIGSICKKNGNCAGITLIRFCTFVLLLHNTFLLVHIPVRSHSLICPFLTRYPNYYDDLQAQADAARKKAVDLAKAAESGKKAKKGKDDEDGGDGGGEGEAEQETFVDTAAPHPSYVLSPPTARISSVRVLYMLGRTCGETACVRTRDFIHVFNLLFRTS